MLVVKEGRCGSYIEMKDGVVVSVEGQLVWQL